MLIDKETSKLIGKYVLGKLAATNPALAPIALIGSILLGGNAMETRETQTQQSNQSEAIAILLGETMIQNRELREELDAIKAKLGDKSDENQRQ